MTNKLLYFIIASLILLLVSVLIFSNLIKNYIANRNTTTTTSPSPVPSGAIPTAVDLPAVKGQSIYNVPTLNPTEGMGLDLNSNEIKNSTVQIKKIKDKLPYQKSFTSTSGIPVDIVIPSYELLMNKWTLNVNISLIDFEVTPQNPEYEATKIAFLEAARDVFFFLKNNGVNTEQIIIQWGEREIEQTRAEEWLR